jgi:diguanylate cyclase (GGDEF)-like protein
MLTASAVDDFQLAFDVAPCPALLLDRDLTIVACNIAYERVTRVRRSAMLGRFVFDVFPGSSERQTRLIRESYDRVLTTGKPHHIAHIQYATAGKDLSLRERQWTISNFPLLRQDGTLSGILHCPTDITELMQLRQASRETGQEPGIQRSMPHWTRSLQNILHLEQERLHQLFQQAPGFICVLRGPRHVFELANDAYYQLVGHRRVIGHPVGEVLPEVVTQGFLEKLDNVYATGTPFIGRAMPLELQRVAGGDWEQSYIDLIYQPIMDGAGKVTGIFVQGSDVTESHLLAQEVAHQAAHDFLTGLPNRREFRRQTRKIEEPGPHALLYMDIDHLKIVNDRCGHAAGDSLLNQVSALLKSRCEGGRDILARLGGDEFALVRRNCSPEDALDLAARLCTSVKDINFFWQGKRYGVTLSVGVAGFGGPEGLSFDGALGLADAACFLAKEKGRNRVQLGLPADEDVRQQQRDMDNATRLKEAMREDRILLYAQKIFGLRADQDAEQVFYEVLARLCDVDGTIVPPGSFIPAAERFGLVEELDRHIVCKTFAHLQAQPSGQRAGACYFINLSGITLSAQGFLGFIEGALAAYPAVRSSRICFEVTETAALSNIHRTAEAMRRLIDMGFRFALDDFGSGMASFTYLRHLPVQFVKIDGEFIRAVHSQPANAIIVEAIARVAHTMDMRTIAESVEDEEMIPHLRSLGLDYAQGFALHHPEPIEICQAD